MLTSHFIKQTTPIDLHNVFHKLFEYIKIIIKNQNGYLNVVDLKLQLYIWGLCEIPPLKNKY